MSHGPQPGEAMIVRVWHGWTTPENAPVYEALLRTEIFPSIAARGVAGYLSLIHI